MKRLILALLLLVPSMAAAQAVETAPVLFDCTEAADGALVCKAVAPMATPQCDECERTLTHSTHIGHAVSAHASHLRAVHSIEWPSGLTFQFAVNDHCVVADPADDAGCSLGNLSGVGDLQTAGVGIGYSRDVGPVKVRAIVDANYAGQVEAGKFAIGAELRVEKDRLAGYVRYGTGLNDDLDPLFETAIDGVHFGVALVF